jgi:hypothetical protein
MKDYLLAVDLINDSGDGDFEGDKSESLIEKAEQSLNLKFPPSYRRFLKEFGCGDIGGEEFYGLINEEFTDSTVPNGIWLTLNERKNIGLSKEFVIIYSTGDGTYYALDTSRTGNDGECPVVALTPDGQTIEDVAEDFGKFFYDTVNAAL